jgi:hypothetical protein
VRFCFVYLLGWGYDKMSIWGEQQQRELKPWEVPRVIDSHLKELSFGVEILGVETAPRARGVLVDGVPGIEGEVAAEMGERNVTSASALTFGEDSVLGFGRAKAQVQCLRVSIFC